MSDRKGFLETAAKQPEQAVSARLFNIEAAERQISKAILYYPQIFPAQQPLPEQVKPSSVPQAVRQPTDAQGTIIDNVRDRRLAEARQMLDDAFNPAMPSQSVTHTVTPQHESAAQVVDLDQRRQQAQAVRRNYGDVLGESA